MFIEKCFLIPLIEQVYNQKQPHSVLRYLTPIEFDQKTCRNFLPNCSIKSMAL